MMWKWNMPGIRITASSVTVRCIWAGVWCLHFYTSPLCTAKGSLYELLLNGSVRGVCPSTSHCLSPRMVSDRSHTDSRDLLDAPDVLPAWPARNMLSTCEALLGKEGRKMKLMLGRGQRPPRLSTAPHGLSNGRMCHVNAAARGWQ